MILEHMEGTRTLWANTEVVLGPRLGCRGARGRSSKPLLIGKITNVVGLRKKIMRATQAQDATRYVGTTEEALQLPGESEAKGGRFRR